MDSFERALLRDRVIEFLFTRVPCLLGDEEIAEWIIAFIVGEVQRAVMEKSERLTKQVLNPN